MNPTKTNLISNFAGRSVAAILGIIFVPIYLRYLSVEMYGIIGFFTSVQAFLFLLDGGISPTLNREVARLSVFAEKVQELSDLSRTLELLCWATGVAVCGIAIIASPFAAYYWLRPETISPNVVQEALMIMSVALVFQWTIGFYTGGMHGLQEQKLLNIVNIVLAFARSVGAFLVLAFVSPTIKAFLIWQLAISIVNCFTLKVLFWKKLPRPPVNPKFRLVLLKDVWRYAAGMAGTSLVVLVLSQTDKIILSKMLTLEGFGYYSLAFMLAGTGIGMIVGSIQTTYFPQFSRLVALNKPVDLASLYHRACQVMTFFLIPVVGILTFFSYEVLLLWTGKPEIAENTYILLSLVAIGTGLNGLMHLPYYVQLAFGITKIGFWQNAIAIIFLIPFMIYATQHYGAVGGALTWAILSLSCILIALPVMHRIILRDELGKWYSQDTGKPLLVASVFLFICRYLISLEGATTSTMIVTVSLVFTATTLLTGLILPEIRGGVFSYLKKSSYGI